MRVARKFELSIGHRLSDYSGKCRHLHGHNYLGELIVEHKRLNKLGMIIDFGELKEIIRKTIDLKFDHKFVMKRSDLFNQEIARVCKKYKDDSIVWVDYNPTVENMAKDMVEMVRVFIPWGKITLHLSETSNSYTVTD